MRVSQFAQLAEPVSGTSHSALRTALGAFATGVTIVTSAGDTGSCGVTVNAFSSLSLAPPLVLVCLRSDSTAGATIAGNRAFAINVLTFEQEAVARRFASPRRPRGRVAFTGLRHRVEATGAPILEDVAAWLDCELVTMPTGGDHRIVIGRVVAFDSYPGRSPLVFHEGCYHTVTGPPVAEPRPRSLPFVISSERG